MTPKIMITNNGVHPSDRWAAMTASEICDLIQINETSASPEAIAARKAKPRLELDLADLLETFHANVQKHERELLAAHGDAHLVTPLDPSAGEVDTPQEVVAEIVKIAAKTPFGAHFALPQVQEVVRGIVDHHFALSIDIERSTWADKNPDSETAKAYRLARNDHGPRLVHLHAAAPKAA